MDMPGDSDHELTLSSQGFDLFNRPNPSQPSIFRSIINWTRDCSIKILEYRATLPDVLTTLTVLKHTCINIPKVRCNSAVRDGTEEDHPEGGIPDKSDAIENEESSNKEDEDEEYIMLIQQS